MSAKNAISKLEARVLQLEDLLRQNSIEQPANETSPDPGPSSGKEKARGDMGESQDESTTASVNGSFGQPLSNTETASPTAPTGPEEATVPVPTDTPGRVGVPESLGTYDFDFLPSDHDIYPANQDDNFVFLQTPSPTSQASRQHEKVPRGHDADERSSEASTDIEGILSARMGSLRIAEDGQLRYYGPTSNLNVQSNGVQSLSRSMIRDVASEGRGVLQKLGLDHPVSFSLEDHLAKLYFAWEDPAIHIIDEQCFVTEKRRCQDGATSSYYSETLNNAM